jgi:hypothetical protein
MKMIDTVLGFDFNLELIGRDGDLVKPGIKHTCAPETDELPNIGNSFGNTRWFTNFNEGLLQKIRDYKRLNT